MRATGSGESRPTLGISDCGAPASDEEELKRRLEWSYRFRVEPTRRFLDRTEAENAR